MSCRAAFPLHFLLQGRFTHIVCNISAVGSIWLQRMQNYESWAGETDNSSPLAFHQKKYAFLFTT